MMHVICSIILTMLAVKNIKFISQRIKSLFQLRVLYFNLHDGISDYQQFIEYLINCYTRINTQI